MGFSNARPLSLILGKEQNIRVMAAKLAYVRDTANDPQAPIHKLLVEPMAPILDLYILYSIAQNTSAKHQLDRLVVDYYTFRDERWKEFFKIGNYGAQSHRIVVNIETLHEIAWFEQNWPLSPGVDIQVWKERLPE